MSDDGQHDHRALLAVIERYYDAVPRTAARAETLGPFTLFVTEGPGWPYYARPSLGAAAFTDADVTRVRERQRQLGVPESFEWVGETSPRLRAVAEAAGLTVMEHPLMALPPGGERAGMTPSGVVLRLATPDDDVPLYSAVARIAFGEPGTAVGETGTESLTAAVERDEAAAAFQRERLRAGRTVTAVALVDGVPVAVGSHQPVGAVTEVVGVGTLPAFRRRGLAAALTRLLVADARQRGVRTVFLSADDAAVAHLYAGAGFQTIGTACIAEPGG
jgi:ribosomal protein S18 acetylase RimI-like enzyme